MNLTRSLLTAITIVVLALFLADIQHVVRFRLTYRLAWVAAIAIALGCGFFLD